MEDDDDNAVDGDFGEGKDTDCTDFSFSLKSNLLSEYKRAIVRKKLSFSWWLACCCWFL